MTVKMRAPSSVPAGEEIFFLDGTTTIVMATGLVDVPVDDVPAMLKAGFSLKAYGIVAEAQRASADQALIATTAPTSTGPFGFSAAQAAAIIASINEIQATLVALGAWKGSA